MHRKVAARRPSDSACMHRARLLAAAACVLVALAVAAPAQAADAHPCWTNDVSAGSWQTVDAPGGKVAVHYKLKRPRDRRLAQRLAGEVGNTIYPKLAGLLGREPASDDGHRCQHGPDGRLDVFLAPERRLDIVEIPSGAAA